MVIGAVAFDEWSITFGTEKVLGGYQT